MDVGANATQAAKENWWVKSSDEKAEQAALEKESGQVSHDEFLKLLTMQLSNQDPLNPVQDQEFVGQMAQLQALDEQIELNETLSGMRLDQQLQAGSELIGLHVKGVSATNSDAEGVVTGLTVRSGELQLVLDTGHRVPYTKVNEVDLLQGEAAVA